VSTNIINQFYSTASFKGGGDVRGTVGARGRQLRIDLNGIAGYKEGCYSTV